MLKVRQYFWGYTHLNIKPAMRFAPRDTHPGLCR